MLNHKILEDRGIVILEPHGSLKAEDFRALTRDVDGYLGKTPWLNGLMVYTKEFPGWENWQSLVSHLRFVRDHHQEIKKVALVTDAQIAYLAEPFAKHFVAAEMKLFTYDQYDEALDWL